VLLSHDQRDLLQEGHGAIREEWSAAASTSFHRRRDKERTVPARPGSFTGTR
jgi:hypothetical protein